MVRAAPALSRRSLVSSLVVLASASVAWADSPVTPLPISSINYIFSFGDSYSTSGYDPSLTTQTYATTSGGSNWIQYLANSSTAAVPPTYYDLAASGATTSNGVVFSNGSGDFETQVKSFMEYFSGTTLVPWEAASTLFTLWFGNDDMYAMFAAGTDMVGMQPMLLTAFDAQVAALYKAGARNFLIPNLPALSRSPVAATYGSSGIEQATAYWNSRLAIYVDVFSQEYAGAQAWILPTTSLFNHVLDAPAPYGIKNTLVACASYSTIVNDPTVSDASCVYPLAEYFWRDHWRPSFTVHSLIAELAVSVLAQTTSVIPAGKFNETEVLSPSSIASILDIPTDLPIAIVSETTTAPLAVATLASESPIVANATEAASTVLVAESSTEGLPTSTEVPATSEAVLVADSSTETPAELATSIDLPAVSTPDANTPDASIAAVTTPALTPEVAVAITSPEAVVPTLEVGPTSEVVVPTPEAVVPTPEAVVPSVEATSEIAVASSSAEIIPAVVTPEAIIVAAPTPEPATTPAPEILTETKTETAKASSESVNSLATAGGVFNPHVNIGNTNGDAIWPSAAGSLRVPSSWWVVIGALAVGVPLAVM